ncbi:MAG: KEOPS complex kinase/ATPase Bud32 [Nanoarchaeota archaeon]
MEQIIAQAAEAIILKQGNNVIKRRIKKGYRINELDEKLRKLRTRSEAKLLEKASNLISVPKLGDVNEKTKEIEMEFIDGKKLSEHLDLLKNKFEVMEKVGKEIAKLHDSDIIHGDLTTSNMILVEKGKTSQENRRLSGVFIIDFGLGFISKRIEDKAVDLHLIKQALEAKHFKNWEKLFASFLKGYNSKDKTIILKQLEAVESRGRYRKNAH